MQLTEEQISSSSTERSKDATKIINKKDNDVRMQNWIHTSTHFEIKIFLLNLNIIIIYNYYNINKLHMGNE